MYCADGEAKFWLEPEIDLARNYRLSSEQIAELMQLVEEQKDVIEDAWNKHFGR